MTDEQKTTLTATGLTLGSLVAAIVLVGPAWPTVEAILTFIGKSEQATAMFMGWGFSVVIALTLPYVLPGKWPQLRTQIWVGVAGAVACAIAAYQLSPLSIGAAGVYAVFAGLSSVIVNIIVLAGLFKLCPKLKPRSLLP